MFKFYYRIFRSAVSEWRGMSSKVAGIIAAALAIAAYFSPELAKKSSQAWNGASRWWTAAPIGLFVLYRLLRANYQEFHTLEQQLKTLRGEEEIQSRLGDLLSEASELREEEIASETHFDGWVTRFDGWREEVLDTLCAFGLAADYSLFQNADTMRDQVAAFPINWQKQMEVYDQRLKSHMHALAGIIRTRPKIAFPLKKSSAS
jgi:hypothetical protein